MTAPTTLDFAGLLDTLDYTAGEFVSVCHNDAAGIFRASIGTPAGAPAYAARLPATADIYFGANPVIYKTAGRGTEADVTRLAALVCDLDFKPEGCGSLAVALAVIAELENILGTRTSAVISSGHGLQPYWPISDGEIVNGDVAAARALLKRFGRLVAHVAKDHGAQADSTFDLARVWRAPGSLNNKNPNSPIPVTAQRHAGAPLSMAEVDERLDEYGIEERPDDRAVTGAEISPPAGWTFARRTCPYVAAMIARWPTDRPRNGARNPFVYGQHIRLFSALRYGCLSEADYRWARQVLVDLLAELVSTIQPRRAVKRFEIADMVKHGMAKVAAKTDEQIAAELRSHGHVDWQSFHRTKASR